MAEQGGRVHSGIPDWTALMLSGAAAKAAGVALLVDDLKDFGKFSTEDHPSPIHHWQWGLVLLITGLGLLGTGMALGLARWREENGAQEASEAG